MKISANIKKIVDFSEHQGRIILNPATTMKYKNVLYSIYFTEDGLKISGPEGTGIYLIESDFFDSMIKYIHKNEFGEEKWNH